MTKILKTNGLFISKWGIRKFLNIQQSMIENIDKDKQENKKIKKLKPYQQILKQKEKN